MILTTAKQFRKIGSSNISLRILLLMVIMSTSMLWPQVLSACEDCDDFTSVKFWIGTDDDEAEEKNESTVYKCPSNTFGWYIEWDDDTDWTGGYKIEIWDKTEDVLLDTETAENDDTDEYGTATLPSTSSGGNHFIRGEVARNTDSPDWCDSETRKLVVAEVEIIEPTSFPVYIGLYARLPMKAKVIPATATGGTWSWSMVSGPGTVTFTPPNAKDTFFSANTAGNYTVKAEYSIWGGTCADTSGTIVVRNAKMIFQTGSPPSETGSITRVNSGTFKVVDHLGNPISGATYSFWHFDGDYMYVSDLANTSSTWSGTMVQGGTANCSVTFGGITCEVNKAITVNARSGWSISPTFSPDTVALWGFYPGNENYGLNRNTLDITKTWIILPRDSGDGFEPGYTKAEVSSGPSKGVWYIDSSTLYIDRESVINMFIKSGTTGYPNPPNINWYEHNESQGVDADAYLQGVRNHEAYGTEGNRKGHQALMEDEEDKPGKDAKAAIEDNLGGSSAGLTIGTEIELLGIEIALHAASDDPILPLGSNWGPDTYYQYNFTNSEWDEKNEGF